MCRLSLHRNTRFTAPACQDSLWPRVSRHHLVHPVKKKMELRSAVTKRWRELLKQDILKKSSKVVSLFTKNVFKKDDSRVVQWKNVAIFPFLLFLKVFSASIVFFVCVFDNKEKLA